ncbi:TetR family transcriptional regulator [Saccharopolyspora erythraea NRRL 2338]|uniref:Transcriptional regulatory protein n=2 Tax=Saccharopolyspora erythraea TaxID=1836 RepID=A4FNV3_SACEN|nr:TetR/AcrR family transcriptional regulator [Saccharopolyspora erythraea]EQD86499.1 TetR family transcriptional regulator [Saccharopolyspora erythraea D]PFG99368.1 TetR family transcriptional regulator [Saccharopolyspora erythraea NRRL 2338]QRK89292.1 TetR/AcrR family transcriptional regulator C-terminal domain-containing protein [Saccharopolyspora erythraea]CAM05728.1 transcriptional regulatory protein [Saccharopolyspora erythraea NRRL 2338]
MSVPVPPWQQRAGRSRAGRQPLSLEAIVGTALGLMDREGLDAVSMRRVAQELGTGAASLYAYVRNKSELHELMLDLVIGEIPVPEPDPARWRDQLKQIARDQVRVFAEHPGIAQVVMRTPAPTGPNALAMMEAVLAILRSAGLPDRVVAFAADLLALYPNAVALERSAAFGLPAEELGERMSQVERYFSQLPRETFPTIVALLPSLMAGEGDERFEFGLEVIMRGLESWAG